ncbi:MAG: 16S rRNA (uracil(1498)-N(3))-methyltransferase [Clostridiales bacterium]|nr:16S rRNA (uracil(1498)-N(3))-methyltransferase [Clostridiales bacterium]
MYRFYVDETDISEDNIVIRCSDVNHIKNVLRLNPNDPIIICNGKGKDYNCIIEEISKDSVLTKIINSTTNENELATKIYLFQGIPKKDKMEWIIQKAVELGVYEIIPVSTKRTIVKISNQKKEKNKLERWQSIATAAAKQSNRGIIPSIHEVLTFSDALNYASDLECKLIPYENAKGIEATREIIHNLKGSKSIGIFIGPEGGFEEEEVSKASENGFVPITLGKRILRTETAGLALLSMIMLELEE